jgi:CheY-like chemotaxis protein
MPHVLVVDDDRSMRELLRLHLNARGHEVTVAPDAIEGIKALLETDIQLIISDIDMPYLNGVDFVRAVTADPKTHHVPVIFVTGVSDNETWLDAMRAGATGYLTKPVDVNELGREVDKALLGKVRRLPRL